MGYKNINARESKYLKRAPRKQSFFLLSIFSILFFSFRCGRPSIPAFSSSGEPMRLLSLNGIAIPKCKRDGSSACTAQKFLLLPANSGVRPSSRGTLLHKAQTRKSPVHVAVTPKTAAAWSAPQRPDSSGQDALPDERPQSSKPDLQCMYL